MARPLDHDLHVLFMRSAREFTQRSQFRHLCAVASVVLTARPQTVPKTHRDIVRRENVANFIKMRPKEVFLFVRHAPNSHDGAAAGNNARQAIGGKFNKGQAESRMNCEVIHALLGLFNERISIELPRQSFCFSVNLFESLIQRNRSDRYRAVADDPLARFVNILAGRKIHDRIRAPARSPKHLFHFFGNPGTHGRVTDIGVDFGQKRPTDHHGFGFRMVE